MVRKMRVCGGDRARCDERNRRVSLREHIAIREERIVCGSNISADIAVMSPMLPKLMLIKHQKDDNLSRMHYTC